MLEVQPVAIIAQNKSYLSVNEQQRIADWMIQMRYTFNYLNQDYATYQNKARK
jgi:hypothetical protein